MRGTERCVPLTFVDSWCIRPEVLVLFSFHFTGGKYLLVRCFETKNEGSSFYSEHAHHPTQQTSTARAHSVTAALIRPPKHEPLARPVLFLGTLLSVVCISSKHTSIFFLPSVLRTLLILRVPTSLPHLRLRRRQVPRGLVPSEQASERGSMGCFCSYCCFCSCCLCCRFQAIVEFDRQPAMQRQLLEDSS